jgi:AraC-like DNA-binding protein/DNA-binding CsgD family transcriptional regulator
LNYQVPVIPYPRDDPRELTDLIGDIYDAALDQTLWPDALGRLSSFIGGMGASVYYKNAASKTGGILQAHGIEHRYRESYFKDYIKLDPTTTGVLLSKVGEPTSGYDFLSRNEFVQTRFFQEWVRPQGMVDAATAVLERSTATAALFSVFRHERDGIVDDETRRRMRLVVPHLRRAVLIGGLIDLKTMQAAAFADFPAAINAGMFLVDGGARIVHANSAGHVMLDEADVLGAIGGKLATVDPQADQALNELIAAASFGDAAIGGGGVSLPLTSHRNEPYVAHILPLTSGDRRRAGLRYAAVAAVFVCKAVAESSSLPEVVSKTYDLTVSELRVGLAIVELGSICEVAVALGIPEAMVEQHLEKVLRKTGAGDRADLIKLVARFAGARDSQPAHEALPQSSPAGVMTVSKPSILRFSTDDVPLEKRAAVSHEAFARLHVNAEIAPLGAQPYRARFEQQSWSSVSLLFAHTDPVSLTRTAELVGDGNDDFRLAWTESAAAQFTALGVVEEIDAGKPMLLFNGAVGKLSYLATGHVNAIRIGYDALTAAVRGLEAHPIRKVAPDAPALQLLMRYVALLRQEGPGKDPVLAHRASQHIIDLCALALGPTEEVRARATGGALRTARLATVRADILANLSQVRLSPKMIANRHGVSDRYVHLLFEDTGQTFSQFVEERRLQRAFALLTDPARFGMRIGDIATEVGFAEQSTFNRAFRRRFGDAPGNIRGRKG